MEKRYERSRPVEEEIEEKIREVENILQRIKEGDTILERARELEAKRRRRALAISDKLRREEEKRIEDVRKKERMDRKRRMEERWEIVLWLTDYIGENTDRWEVEKRLQRGVGWYARLQR